MINKGRVGTAEDGSVPWSNLWSLTAFFLLLFVRTIVKGVGGGWDEPPLEIGWVKFDSVWVSIINELDQEYNNMFK
jgi:hypothetical protein